LNCKSKYDIVISSAVTNEKLFFRWRAHGSQNSITRACTGFDGDFEVTEAIGGGDHLKTSKKINAEDNLALAA